MFWGIYTTACKPRREQSFQMWALGPTVSDRSFSWLHKKQMQEWGKRYSWGSTKLQCKTQEQLRLLPPSQGTLPEKGPYWSLNPSWGLNPVDKDVHAENRLEGNLCGWPGQQVRRGRKQRITGYKCNQWTTGQKEERNLCCGVAGLRHEEMAISKTSILPGHIWDRCWEHMFHNGLDPVPSYARCHGWQGELTLLGLHKKY